MSHPVPSWKPVTDTEQQPPASDPSGQGQGAGCKGSSRSVLQLVKVLVLLSLVGTQGLQWSPSDRHQHQEAPRWVGHVF